MDLVRELNLVSSVISAKSLFSDSDKEAGIWVRFFLINNKRITEVELSRHHTPHRSHPSHGLSVSCCCMGVQYCNRPFKHRVGILEILDSY